MERKKEIFRNICQDAFLFQQMTWYMKEFDVSVDEFMNRLMEYES